MTYQRLRYRRIDAVHRHVVPVIGRPSKRQLGHIAGADHQTSVFIGNIHQHLGTLPGLGIFIGHAVVLGIMADILKMPAYRCRDRYFPKRRSQFSRHLAGVLIGPVCRPKTRHGHCRNTFPVQGQGVKGFCSHQKGQRGIQSAGNSHHCMCRMGMSKPFL